MEIMYTSMIVFSLLMTALTLVSQVGKNTLEQFLGSTFNGLLSILVFLFFTAMLAASAGSTDVGGTILAAISVLGIYLSVTRWFNSLNFEGMKYLLSKAKRKDNPEEPKEEKAM